MAAQPEDYSTTEIVLMSFEENVRARPQMYFGCHRENAGLVGAVVNAVVLDALSEPDQVDIRVEVVLESDHRFTVTDNIVNQMGKLDGNGLPLRRWVLNPLLAVSARTWIEIRTANRHQLHEFSGTTPISSPREQEPTGSPGTRITCTLNRDYFPVTAVLPRAESLLRAPDDRVIVRDLRR
ncbi:MULTISPECIES: hypothetical protein [Nocardia]|uniref:hypothetical protein n=1 Tax=Nocardia TaxID=1817 RepID=UPI001356BF96|nr:MULTISPECIES: hypothetical protein [Nocardia]